MYHIRRLHRLNAKKLAYGKYRFYDAQALESQTYEAILKLIGEHSGETSRAS